MPRRATKTDIRESIRILTDHLAVLKEAVTADDGLVAIAALEDAEIALGETWELLEDRYDDLFEEEEEIVEVEEPS